MVSGSSVTSFFNLFIGGEVSSFQQAGYRAVVQLFISCFESCLVGALLEALE